MEIDPRIDAYIEKAEPFAKPILIKMRNWVHKTCPEVKETIKWGMPAFEYHGPLCSIASFKQHCVFAFWKDELIKDPKKILQKRAMQGGSAMGHLGRITSVKDLPSLTDMSGFIKQVMKLNREGIKIPVKKQASKKGVPLMPADFRKRINNNLSAKRVFDEFPPSAKKEYIEWITDAKTDETRDKRLLQAVEWISEGKRRNWKYEKKK